MLSLQEAPGCRCGCNQAVLLLVSSVRKNSRINLWAVGARGTLTPRETAGRPFGLRFWGRWGMLCCPSPAADPGGWAMPSQGGSTVSITTLVCPACWRGGASCWRGTAGCAGAVAAGEQSPSLQENPQLIFPAYFVLIPQSTKGIEQGWENE